MKTFSQQNKCYTFSELYPRMGEESIGLEADWIGLEADRCNFFVTLEASIIESAQF